MSTCQQCGISAAPNQLACATCATATASANPSAKPEADISALWRIRFDLVEKAGGPALSQVNQMRWGERLRLVFNLCALLFGVFYYLAKGMWRKAIVMTLIGVIAVALVNSLAPDGDVHALTIVVRSVLTAWFGLMANIHYYKKVVLGDNGWW